MAQTHPRGPYEKLLRRFYEPLVLLSVLDPTRGAQRPDLLNDRGLDARSKLWRNFVDQMSWLCVSDAGGDTVTALAAQKTVEGSIFWVASNSTHRKKAQIHLKWLCDQLNRLHTDETVSTSELENKIATECIKFGLKRVKTYTSRLLQCIKRARNSMKENKISEDELLDELFQQIENLAHDPHQLCAFAHQCRRDEPMKILSKRHVGHSSRGVWSDIRHYVGRLGSWTKATKVLIKGAETFPQVIENAQIKVVEPNGPVNKPNKDHITDVKDALKRMLRANEGELVTELHQILENASPISDIEQQFRETYSTIKPRAHAELLVLEHFHRNRLEFIDDDRYIGCSKPSCYCCHLYFQCHPGGFAPRPCHGNLWTHWAPPLPLTALTNSGARPQEHETFKMLQAMLVHIRRDLQDQILSKKPRRGKLPDSTTGMSSVTFGEYHGPSQDTIQSGMTTTLVNTESALVDSDFPDGYSSVSHEQEEESTEMHHQPVKRKRSQSDFQPDPSSIISDDDYGEEILFKGRNRSTL